MAKTRTEELRTFIAVARLGNFAQAARELNLSASAVSKQIGTLEARLGVRLLNRTTRALSLTEVGKVFLERGVEILTDLEQLEDEICGLQSAPRGTIRVSAPQDFGRHVLSKELVDFAALYPDLRVELDLSDRLVDVVEEGYDVVLRVAKPIDSSLVMRRLAHCRRILCATTSYLNQYGRPAGLADLEKHNCIEYEYLADQRWKFLVDGEIHSISPSGRLKANAGWAMRQMALAGLGIALLPKFLVDEDLKSGDLEEVVIGELQEDIDVMALVPHRKQLAMKVRVFVDFLVDTFTQQHWAD